MARSSSDNDSAARPMERSEVRAANQGMVDRLLARPAQPLVEDGYALRVLQTRGRVSGATRRAPLGVALVGGQCYVVSPDPQRDWVRNLVADPRCALLAGDGRDPCRAVPVAGHEAATVVAAYLAAVRVPWAVRAFPVTADAPPERIVEHLDTIAVFRLDPAQQ